MENLGSLNRRVVNLSSVNGLETATAEKGSREGGRVRAYRVFAEILDKAEAGEWSYDQIRAAMVAERDGVAPTTNSNGTTKAPKLFYLGQTQKGNWLYQPAADMDVLKELFTSLWGYKSKKAALAALDAKDPSGGAKVF